MKESIQETINNHVSSILDNINQIKKQNKLYVATTYEKELEDIAEQIEVLDIKIRNEVENL